MKNAPDPATMKKTPTIKKGGKSVTTDKTEMILETEHPSVAIFGCGGCGTNLVNRFGSDLSDEVDIRIVDTSKSNMVDTPYKTKIIDGNGSGKVRASNLDIINKYISSEAFEEEEAKDINIVIFSLSGGSGSVIGPLLINELHRQDKAVVAIVVAEMTSQLDTENTSKTFMSLESICNSGIYLPVMVFDNSRTRSKVDIVIGHRLKLLTDFLTSSVFELDKSDKINWLRPDKAIGTPAGVYGIHMAQGKAGDYSEESGEVLDMPKDHIYDSVAYVSQTPDQSVSMDSRILYHGIDNQIGDNTVVGLVGFPISTKFVGLINSKLSKYQSQAATCAPLGIQTKSVGTNHNSGLVI
jgi:hypothetical protein